MLRYLALRILAFFETVFIGMTAVFVITRLNPTDPVDSMLARLTSMGRSLPDAEYASLRPRSRRRSGCKGPIWEQYGKFLYHNLIQFDFGPSFASYPTPVIDQIARRCHGRSASCSRRRCSLGCSAIWSALRRAKSATRLARLIESVAILLYPIPYYMMALLLIILFTYIWPFFPLSTSISEPEWSVDYVGVDPLQFDAARRFPSHSPPSAGG